jgi:predicted  nucleic acid-binding Zn-ribbon protein
MGQKDAESKRLRADVLSSQEQLNKDKTEFQEILKSFQAEKTALETEKQTIESDRRKVAGQMENIGHFIQAIRRDISVLGL